MSMVGWEDSHTRWRLKGRMTVLVQFANPIASVADEISRTLAFGKFAGSSEGWFCLDTSANLHPTYTNALAQVFSPADPFCRGSQLSLAFSSDMEQVHDRISAEGVCVPGNT